MEKKNSQTLQYHLNEIEELFNSEEFKNIGFETLENDGTKIDWENIQKDFSINSSLLAKKWGK